MFNGGEYLKIINSSFTENSGDNGSAIGYYASNSIIDYCNFTDNNANNYSSIYITASHINITNSEFNDNVAKRAGAILWNGNYGLLVNSTFNRNNATSKSSGAIHWNGKDGIIDYCNFTDNYAMDRSGGAVRWANQNGTINHCNFINNTADLYAGAVYWEGNDGNILNSNFTGNIVKGILTDDYGYETGYGGAVYISSRNVLVNNSNFENNSAKSVRNNIKSAYGGAIYSTGRQTCISNSTFTNNTASKYGGAIYLGGKDSNVSNSNFTNCSSGISGGAVYWNGFNGIIDNSTFNDCYVENHDVDLKGGAIYWNADNGTVKNCTLTDCMINKTTVNNNVYGGGIYWNGENGTVDNSTFVHCYLDADHVNDVRGLCIYWSGKNGVVNNTIFENCSSVMTDSNGFYLGSAVYWNATEGFIDNSTFRHMNSMYGAAILINENSLNTTVKNSTFYNCTSSHGGAIYSDANNAKITNSTFINCSSMQYGGVVFIMAENNIIKCSNFTNCSADEDGGAVYWEYDGINGTLANSTFDNCYAGEEGGAVYWNAVNGTLTDSNFTDCSAINNGGAVIWFGDDGSLANSTFDNCSAKHGGAVYWVGKNSNLTDSNFTDCSANDGGAVIWFGGNGSLANSTFNNCSVNNNGGAVYWNAVNGTITDSNFINCSANKGGALIWFRENGNLSSSNFTDCSATTEGGAVYFNGENGTVNDSNFTDCSANDGGAVYWFGSDGTLSNSTFDNCSADYDGGAVNWDGVNGTLTDSNFTDCSAGTDGGAVMWFGDDGSLANSTFINNTAKQDGGAVEWDGDNGNLINSNFTDNTANGNGGAVYWYGDNGTLFGSNFTDCSAVNGGAIYWDSEDGLINDSYFDDNTGNWRNIYLTNPDDVTVSNNTFADTVATIKLNSKIIYGNNETFNGTYDTGVNINKTMNYTVNTTAEYYDLNVTLTGNVDEEVYSNYNVTKPNVGWHEIILGNTDTFNNVYLFSKPDGIFEVIKANSSVEVGDDEVQYNGTANVTLTVTNATDIKVTIKDSKGNNITSTVNIVVDEDYTYILVGNLPSGNYTINVTAVPDDNHNPSSDVGDIKVLPAPSVVIVGNDTIVYDSTANVTVSVVNGTFTKDDVKIFKDDVEITNATVDVVDDIIYVSGLDVGNYTVYVTSNVDENHTSATSSGWINVTKANSTVAFNNTTVVYGDEITIPVVTENSTAGPVIVTVKDKDNNTVDVTVIDDVIVLPENIDVGVYNVVVTTNVTGNYNNATAYGWINVTKANSTVAFNNTTVVYGDEITIPVETVNSTAGPVIVTVKDKDNNTVDVTVIDDVIVLPENIDVGVYNVVVTTNVTGNYNNATAYGWINVTKANSTVAFNNTTVVYGDEITIPVETVNSTAGPVIVTVKDKDNNTVDVTVIDDVIVLPDDLDVGVYNVVVTTNVTGNYNNATAYGWINVTKANSTVAFNNTTVVYGDEITIPVETVNSTAGPVIVKVTDKDNNTVDVTVIDDVIVLPDDLDVGVYNVVVTTNVTGNYNNATAYGWINVTKANSTVAFNNTTVVYGDEITIPVETVNSTAGPVIVKVTDKDNNTVDVTIVDDVIVLPENIDAGIYNVVVTTNVTSNYNNATAYGWINVTKANSTINFNDSEVPYNVTANIPLDVVNATEVTVVVTDSKGNEVDANVTVGPDATYILIDNLPVGNYTVNVTTVPDGNHNPSSAVANLTVVPAPSVVNVGHTEIVYNSTANVTVSVINGTVDESNVEIYNDGQKVIPDSLEIIGDLIYVSGLDVGNYTVNVTCSVDGNHTPSSAAGWINVIRADSALLFNNTTSVYGNEITVPVSTENATGIIVTIVDEEGNPIPFTVDSNNITLPGDLDVGIYYVNITTNVTGNYNNATSTGWINITPGTIVANITVDDVTYPDHPVAVVYASVDGNYTVTVEGKQYPVEVINGTGSVDIDKLPKGNYTAYLTGDIPNYYPVSEEDNFTVKPADPDLKANVSDETPRFGENITVSHELPDDATGNITYYVDGVPAVTLPVNETFTFTPETPGIHNITVHYNGDDKYTPDEVNLTVDVVNYLTIVVDDVYYPTHPIAYVTADYDGNYTIKIYPDESSSEILSASANPILRAGQFTLDVEIINGSASVDLGLLAVGDYMSEIYGELPGIKTYGDEDPFKVLAVSPNLDANVSNSTPTYGDEVTVTPVLPDDATGNVTYIVDGENMGTLPVNESLTFIPKSEGEHVIEIIYNGDGNYTPDSVNKTIHVNKPDSDKEIIPDDSNKPAEVTPEENATVKSDAVEENTVSVLPETGNPIAILVLMFVMIFASYRGRKN